MVLGANEIVAIISALVSIPTSVIIFFISQNYSIYRNRRRLISITFDLIEFTKQSKYKKENEKNLTFSVVLNKIYMYKVRIYFSLFIILVVGGHIIAENQFNSFFYFWILAPIVYILASFYKYPLIAIMSKSDKWKLYKFAFKIYPIEPPIAFSIFIMAFFYSYFTTSRDMVYINSILAPIFISIIALVVLIIPFSIIFVSQNAEYSHPDIVTDLYDFFSKEGYIMKTPELRINLNGAQPICGKVVRIQKDLLIISTNTGVEYINWEYIVSIAIVQDRKH